MSSQNLIEIQSNLQNPASVTMQDLIKYANGSNPEVPSFLALIEMNRRKQIEQTSQAFNQQQPQGTIKDQTVSALMGRANPTAAPQGINPAASQQMVNPAMAPTQMDPTQMAQQVNPAAAPPVQAAEGGLMSIPVKHFKTQSFAGGGIVAFNGEEGSDVKYDPAMATRRSDYETEKPVPPRPRYKLGGQEIEGPRSMEEILKGLPSISPMQGKRREDMTPEQAYQRNKEIQKLAGVSEDPYADVKKRQTAIEERQAEQYKGDATNRLLAMAESFAMADPAKGFGFAAASGSKAARVLESEQNSIRNKQEALNLEIQRNLAKEEDARRRGDAAGVKEAMKEVKTDQKEYDRLQMEMDKLSQAQYKTAGDIRTGDVQAGKMPLDIYSAETQRQNADTQNLQARNLAEHQRQTRDLQELTKPTAASKEFSRLNDDFEGSIFVKSLKSKLEMATVGSEEYNNLINTYNKARQAYFKSFMEKNPDMGLPSLPMTEPSPVKKKPGFNLSSLVGGSSSAPAATTMPQGWSVQQNP
jgi:hypothetical protein